MEQTTKETIKAVCEGPLAGFKARLENLRASEKRWGQYVETLEAQESFAERKLDETEALLLVDPKAARAVREATTKAWLAAVRENKNPSEIMQQAKDRTAEMELEDTQ